MYVRWFHCLFLLQKSNLEFLLGSMKSLNTSKNHFNNTLHGVVAAFKKAPMTLNMVLGSWL
jgi:hypothetical protein